MGGSAISSFGTAGKWSFKALTPGGRIAFYFTIGFVLLLTVLGAVKSIQERNIYPLVENTLFRWVGADHILGKDVEALKNAPQFTKGKFLSREWWSDFNPLWYRVKFWFDVLLNIYFMVLLIYLLFKVYMSLNSSLPAINVLLALVTFALLQVVVGLAFFGLNLDTYYPTINISSVGYNESHAIIVPKDKVSILNDEFRRSYPFEGVISLVNHLMGNDLFSRTGEFEESLVGKIILDIPEPGIGINDSGV